jgi:hypothetical protein
LLGAVSDTGLKSDIACPQRPIAGFKEKAVAETALLLMCVEPVKDTNADIEVKFHKIARRLVPLVRDPDKLFAICLEPNRPLDHAFGHIMLNRIGYPDERFTAALRSILSKDANFEPERLPHQLIEQWWLAQISDLKTADASGGLLAQSALSKPLDVLSSSRMDYYAFTHTVMYATDFGRQKVTRARSKQAISDDVDGALAYSLDTDDYDLAAELLFSRLMLDLAWTNTAIFALEVIMRVEAELGFTPGLAFSFTDYSKLPDKDRRRYETLTSYHASYVMGFLCAAILTSRSLPPVALIIPRNSTAAAAGLLSHFGESSRGRAWYLAFDRLRSEERDALAPMLLTMLLQRAKKGYDFGAIQAALEAAVQYDCVVGSAPPRAVALLRRIGDLAALGYFSN